MKQGFHFRKEGAAEGRKDIEEKRENMEAEKSPLPQIPALFKLLGCSGLKHS